MSPLPLHPHQFHVHLESLIQPVDLKDIHNLKVVSYVLPRGNFRDLSPGGSISRKPERTTPRKWEEEPGYTEVLQQRAGSQNIKNWLLIEENKISQVKKFSTFLCVGRYKHVGSLKSSLRYVP